MEYEIKSKPTIYNGTKFRSRLEARWACFFDLLGWRWQYEPFDLQAWTPDFIIYGSDSRYVLMEIKPFIDDAVLQEYNFKIMKCMSAKFQPKCILLSSEFKEDKSYGGVLAGYQICDIFRDQNSWEFMDPYEVHWKDMQNGIGSEYDIGSSYMNFDGLLWDDDDHRKSFICDSYSSYKILVNKWTEAGERTRFHFG